MWFAALGRVEHNPWLVSLVNRLLSDQPKDEVLSLLGKHLYPFKHVPPKAVRILLYEYDFTRLNYSWAKDVAIYEDSYVDVDTDGRWWVRKFSREYMPAVEYGNPSVRQYLDSLNIRHSSQHINHWEQYQKCLMHRPSSSNISEFSAWLKQILCTPLYIRHFVANY